MIIKVYGAARDVLLSQLQEAIISYLIDHGGAASALTLIVELELPFHVGRPYVTAAMWILVEDGVVKYTKNARLVLQ